MLTQFLIPEPQVALFAACPRPRAVAPSAVSPSTPSSSPSWAGSVRLDVAAVTRVVAEERLVGLTAEGMRAFAFSAAPRPAGYATRLIGAGFVGNGGTSTKQQDKQDKQHLTDRRGPVTWRPPH